jgi:hypothetical protein
MRQRGQFVNIEQDDVRGLFFLDNLQDVSSKGDAVQIFLLESRKFTSRIPVV